MRKLWFRFWNLNRPAESGTGHKPAGYPGDLLNRIQPAFLRIRPLLIGLGKLVAVRPSRSEIKTAWRFVMPSRRESTRASARLQLETAISDDASLLELQAQAAEYVREAKRRAPSEPNELVSSVVDAVARDYFRHAIEKQRKRTR
jgi:hypothetical protein